MNNPKAWLSLAVLLAGLSTSCILLDNPEGDDPGWRRIPEPRDRAETRPEEPPEDVPERRATDRTADAARAGEFRDTLRFMAGGTLTLENDFGDVAIRGWASDLVEVVAKSAGAPSRGGRSLRGYDSRVAAPDVEIRETGAGLLVRTPTFEGLGQPPDVTYEVRVPESVNLAGIRISEGDLAVSDCYGGLEASVDEGNLLVRNYSGPVRATIGIGDADVEILDLRDRDEIVISTRRGDIVLRLERDAGAIVEANAPRGEIASDFDLGRRLPASSVKGWIGQGGPMVILTASDGRIQIVRTQGGAAAAPGTAGGK
ncbi:MAG: hypothetical protein JW775_03595 [Candidatus Aminicenantes bacterium]|nr:hypothetical protein [Candidatus Aminicenantes bacterium]